MEKGVVTKIKGNTAYVRLINAEDCAEDACGGCKFCLFGKPQKTDEPMLNTLCAKEGDVIEVKRVARNRAVPALILFGLPLFAMVVAAIIASNFVKTEWLLAVIVLSAAFAMLGATIGIDAVLRKKGYFGAKMIQIIKD